MIFIILLLSSRILIRFGLICSGFWSMIAFIALIALQGGPRKFQVRSQELQVRFVEAPSETSQEVLRESQEILRTSKEILGNPRAKRRTSWTEGESRWVGLQVVFPGFSRILPTQILLVFIFVVLCSVQKFGVRRKDDFGDGAIRYFFSVWPFINAHLGRCFERVQSQYVCLNFVRVCCV